jgi:hypothetical protein
VGKKDLRTHRIRCNRRGGFSLVEVAILAVLLLVAVGGLSGAVLSSLRLARTTEESSLGDEAARALAARMQAQDFHDLFYLYNAYPKDDPLAGLAEGTAPGAAFDVVGLTARAGDPDGHVGRIVFPTVDLPGGVTALREDVVDPRLGMPSLGMPGRDLNGDGNFDALDHAGDYVLLPARLIVEWTGAGGDRAYELDVVLGQ